MQGCAIKIIFGFPSFTTDKTSVEFRHFLAVGISEAQGETF